LIGLLVYEGFYLEFLGEEGLVGEGLEVGLEVVVFGELFSKGGKEVEGGGD
jgi:hypothetical protein